MTVSSPVTELKGVAEKRAKLYKKIGIETVGDLLDRFPRGYIDFTSATPIARKDKKGSDGFQDSRDRRFG